MTDLACLLLLQIALGAPAPDVSPSAWRCTGTGMVADHAHPWRPGDSREFTMKVRVSLDQGTGEGEIAFLDTDDPNAPPDCRFWRRGRLFSSNPTGDDLPPGGYGDLSPAAIAVLHPALVDTFMRERPENTDAALEAGSVPGAPPRCVAMNDVLWKVEPAAPGADTRIAALSRAVHDDVHGTMTERVKYDGRSVTVTRTSTRAGAEPWILAKAEFGAPEPLEKFRTPKGDTARDVATVLPPEACEFRELGGGLFACEFAATNARVFVVELADGLLVFEGCFSSRNAETIAAAARKRFGKPVTHFAFSHIHPQYVAGVRAWASKGATILVPPTSVKTVTDALAAPFDLRPDAWSRAPGTPKVQTVADRWTREDASTSVVLINDPKSDHTDEYLLLHMPRMKTLVTGDLLFYRPGSPLTGRSLTLARYVQQAGILVDRCITTWPLEWPGRNELTGDELRAAAKAGEEYEAKAKTSAP